MLPEEFQNKKQLLISFVNTRPVYYAMHLVTVIVLCSIGHGPVQ
jgi:hypothetical protein